MPPAHAHSVALTGLDGHVVDVAAEIIAAPARLTLPGLPETSWREIRDRIRAAVINSGESWPHDHVAVTVTPGVRSSQGSGFDLAIAVAILAAAGRIPCPPPRQIVFLGELGLDGRLRPVRGVLPAVTTAAAGSFAEVIVPEVNAAEAAVVPGVHVTGAPDLAAVIHRLRAGSTTLAPQAAAPPASRCDPPASSPKNARPDLADLTGQQPAKRAAEICAAGGHHLLLTGPPGTGKTLLAERIPGLMPSLERVAALEVAALQSLAGTLPPGDPLSHEPPLASPHHTASQAAVLGGGSGLIRPGAAPLAHHGVLFLDEAPEFDRDVLDALRQPLTYGQVTLTRGGGITEFPADFTLILAASPCPCARLAGSGETCTCTPGVRRRYLARLAGLLDRIDITARFRPPERAVLAGVPDPAEPSAVIAARVAAARQRAAQRLAGTPWRLNARIPGPELRRRFPATPSGMARIERAVDLGKITATAADRVLGLSWTLADLAGTPQPGSEEVTHALWLRLGPDA